jgi:exopolyphosphatase/guanosine-5'-triphosphate,3'-diphosphate pyrophosphatase
MRIAAIDIGTNSVHMIVVRLRPDFSYEIIDREKEMVRLGAGGLDGRKLTPEAMASALAALSKFERLASSHQVDAVLAAATSATREAENGGEFLQAIERQIGIRARIITGTEEARLIHLAAVYGVDTPRPAVVIDIGGGSVEITLGSGESVTFARSFKIGVIRLTERFVTSDPLSGRDERKLVKHIGAQVDRYIAHIVEAGFDRVIGTSGTVLSIGSVATAHDKGQVPSELRNLRVPARSIKKVRKMVTGIDLEARLKIPGLDPRRADLVVAGSVLLDTLLKKLGADEITLCDLALREGLILDYVRQHRSEIARVDRYPDVRRRSAIELAERSNWEQGHSQQVARVALRMFDDTRAEHRLGNREREWLEYAALLHDVGNHISYERHHRHSYYLIKNGDLRGFEPDEIEVIALVARYHRRAEPKRSHEGYGDLAQPLRRTVRLLASLLRVAESLDRSQNTIVRDVTLKPQGDRFVLQVQTDGDAELEVWAANRQIHALERALGRTIGIETRHLDEDANPAAPREARHRKVEKRGRTTAITRAKTRADAAPLGNTARGRSGAFTPN